MSPALRRSLWLVAALGVGGVVFWIQNPREPAVSAWEVPARPDLRRWPVEMSQRWEALAKEAQSGRAGAETWAAWARLCHANGFAEQAEQLWRRAEAAARHDGRWAYYRGELALRRGQANEAAQHFARASEKMPDYLPVWIRRGDLALEAGDVTAAGEAYARAKRLAPETLWVRLVTLNYEVRHRRQPTTRESVRALAAEFPEVRSVQTLWADVLQATGDEAGAARQRTLALEAELAPSMPDPLIDALGDDCYDGNRLGLLAMKMRREDRALEGEKLLRRGIAVAPQDLTLRVALAKLFQWKGRPEEALRVMEEACRDLPDEVEARTERARLLCLLGRADEAVMQLRAEEQRWSEEPSWLAALGYSLREAKRSGEARRVLEAALRAGASYPEVYYNLGYCLVLAGERSAGLAQLQRALVLRPEYREPALLLATLALEERNGDEADRWARALRERFPRDEQAAVLFGAAQLYRQETFRREQNLVSARAALQEGRAAAPGIVALWQESLSLEEEAGSEQQVLSLVREWTEQQPESGTAWLKRGDYERKYSDRAAALQSWKRAFSLGEMQRDEGLQREATRRLQR